MMSLENGLVHLKTNSDIAYMVAWVSVVREIEVYLTHRSHSFVKSMLIGEMYDAVRKLWPKEVLREISDDGICNH
ncbi:hypothetical protein LIER_09022 [Lithospermum erythrorhizon]|uniref:Uncharacterized protein n=1 Tax=Lithospermum erythrorhizon TaxID=34254 RepID=A0AAV3PFD9_LITER